MRLTLGLGVALIAAIVVGVAVGDDSADRGQTDRTTSAATGAPSVEIVAPRNGSRQVDNAVVVRVRSTNLQLAPAQFGQAPQLGQGHFRFSLNRVPDCVDPAKLQNAISNPLGAGRLIGRSLDFPRYSGPNGDLAAAIGSAGNYSPSTAPTIYYQRLPVGFYRLIVTIARNDTTSTPYHDVTNFEIVRGDNDIMMKPRDCKGKISSAEAAKQIR